MKARWLAALLGGLCFCVHAADRAPMTVEDLAALDRVDDPQLSPDGSMVAYTVAKTDLNADKRVRSVWVAEIGSGHVRPVTGATGNADTPRWGPGGELYFLSDRTGSSQVWRFDMKGSPAVQVTDLPRDVNTYVLAPDGTRIALSMDVFRDCGSDVSCTVTRFVQRGASHQNGIVYDQLFVRHWDTWRDGTRAQLFTARVEEGKAGPVTLVSGTLEGDVPSKPDGDDSEIAFTPDGRQVVFAMRVAGYEEAWSTNLDLWRVNTDGSGEAVNLTADNPATDTSPVITQDGRVIWLAMSQPQFESDRSRIMIKPLGGGAAREIAPKWDRSPTGIALSDDGRTVFAIADDLGSTRLFAVDVGSGRVTPLTGDGTVEAMSVGAKGIAITHDTLDRPADVWFAKGSSGDFRQLTRQNAERLDRIRMADFEPFSFKGWNDETVHGVVMKPANFESGKKYPVAFVVHGGPQVTLLNLWHYRWNLQTFAGMGYAVIAIDYHGSTGYGQEFTDSISGDWGGKPLEDLKKGYVYAVQKFRWLDGGNACALGGSFGGYMMNWFESAWPGVFECLVNHDGTFDVRFDGYTTDELWFDEWEMRGTQYDQPDRYEEHNPINHVAEWETPMLVIHGDLDYRNPIEHGIASFTALQRRGIESQFLRFPDENHWVLKPNNSIQWYRVVRAWLDRHLKGPPPDPADADAGAKPKKKP